MGEAGERVAGRENVNGVSGVTKSGFEKGLPTDVPTYSSGVYFPPENIAPLLQLIRGQRAEWTQLSQLVTGYDAEICGTLTGLIEEALLWAQREGCGLMEGDDLVGSLGAR